MIGVQNSSNRRFVSNQSHRYPDLVANDENASDIEIKVSLENNKPKGHLAKSGYYLTIRYFLGDDSGRYMEKPNRGDIVWVWDIRFGFLDDGDFNVSNTEGDSGKTAVINQAGWEKMGVLFSERS